MGSNVFLGSIVKDTYKPFSNNQFRMIDEGGFNILDTNYNTARTNLIDCETDPSYNCATVINAALGYNTVFDSDTIDQTTQWSLDEPAILNYGAQIFSNELSAILQDPIAYPTFRLEIDVAEVGIFQTVGSKPVVTCERMILSPISCPPMSRVFKLVSH